MASSTEWKITFEAIYNYSCPVCGGWQSQSTKAPKVGHEIVCMDCGKSLIVPDFVWHFSEDGEEEAIKGIAIVPLADE